MQVYLTCAVPIIFQSGKNFYSGVCLAKCLYPYAVFSDSTYNSIYNTVQSVQPIQYQPTLESRIKYDAFAEKKIRPFVIPVESLARDGFPYEDKNGYVYINYVEFPQTIEAKTMYADKILQKYSTVRAQKIFNKKTTTRHCSRCFLPYLVEANTKNSCLPETCRYHWGKLKSFGFSSSGEQVEYWTCCHESGSKEGCTTASNHVWSGLEPGINGPLQGFVKTKPAGRPGPYGVFALDCEMVSTTEGLELARVTIAQLDSEILLDTLVKPKGTILDYHTKFSGLKEEDFENFQTMSLKAVQKKILNFVYAETILVGHSLSGDLRALKIVHKNLLDTSHLFPHPMGFPFKNSLKMLAQQYLDKKIQLNEHDSVEDAITALELAKFKIFSPPS